jgi:hypothetical protein
VLVPCFLLFLCFRKVTQEIFSELDETKPEPPIFTEALQTPKMTWRGARGQPHHQGARPSLWPRPPMVRASWSTPDDDPSPIKSPRREKPKGHISFSRNILQAAAVGARDREDPGALLGTLPERGIPAGGLLHHHGRLRSDV